MGDQLGLGLAKAIRNRPERLVGELHLVSEVLGEHLVDDVVDFLLVDDEREG